MAFTVTTSTLGGIAARLITGTGNLDDLASALSTHGVTQTLNTITFGGTGANTYYVIDGTLTEQRVGTREIRVGTQSFLCLSHDTASVTTLGKIESNGATSSKVNVRYTNTHFAQGADPFNSAKYKCYAGAGTLNFEAGELYYECATRSDMDVWNAPTAVSFKNVLLHFYDNGGSSYYSHLFTNTVITSTDQTSFLTPASQLIEVVGAVSYPAAITINSFYTNTGLRIVYAGATSVTTVNNAKYTTLEGAASTLGAVMKSYDPATTYHGGQSDPVVLTIYRTIYATFKDTLAVAITSPAPNLLTVPPTGAKTRVAYSAGAASTQQIQSYTTASSAYTSAGTNWTNYGNYAFYSVGFGYAASYTAVDLKTVHLGNDGIPWAAVSSKSSLVTTAYASVVTSGFALTTGTDTLAITTSRTTDQSAEYLFKLAYDNTATINSDNDYWIGKVFVPATQNATGYIDFGVSNITVTAVTLSGTAFATTGTITLASSAICSANVVKTSGVFSAGPINNVTGTTTLTGTARWDITTGGTAHGGSAAATNTIRVTTAASGANFDFQAFVFNASTTFENTSGNPITLIMSGGQVQPTKLETSGTITFSAPIIQQTVTVSGAVAGSRIQIYDTTSSTELYNGTPSFPYTWTDPVAAAAGRAIRLRVAKQSTVTAYEFIEANIGTCGTTSGDAAVSYLVSQTLDTTYNTNAIDGSTVTGITITPGPGRVSINLAGGSTTYPRIYAYQVYWLATATGIADEAAFISATDTANYLFTGFKIKNTSATPLTITGGYGRDATSGTVADIIDSAGSTGNIYPQPDHAIPYSSGSGLTAGQAAQLAAIPDAAATATAVLSAATTTPIAADVKKVNGYTISGAGTAGDPWGP